MRDTKTPKAAGVSGRPLLWLWLTAGGLLFPHLAPAAEKTSSEPRIDSSQASQQVVQRILNGEREGRLTERRRRLRDVLRQSPEDRSARWQSGYVRHAGKWVPFAEAASLFSDNAVVKEYRRQRSRTPNSVAGHLQMAAWCAKNKLSLRRRAHLTAVLEIDPNHRTARAALGYQKIGPFWFSKRERARQLRAGKQAARNLKRWTPRITSLRKGLTSGSAGRYRLAVKRLKAIDDPAAVPAIELILADHSPQLAGLVVDFLGRRPHQAATMALARQAVFSPWKSVRQSAAEKLKERKLEHFVPQVLSITSTPVRSRQLLYVGDNGSLSYSHLASRETRNLQAVGVFNGRRDNLELIIPVPPLIRGAGAPLLRQSNASTATRRELEALQAGRELALRRQFAVEEINRLLAERNQRVRELLTITAGCEFDDDPKSLWSWWDDYTEVYNPENKPVVVECVHRRETTVVPRYVSSCSCLTAGTPVWTDRGPVAIEKVRIGDLVLSQEVETGELAYKPVLKTTVRPPVPLLSLQIGTRTVGVTGGHPFWVSGKGWTKARDIAPGTVLHDVHGTTSARIVGKADPQKTYNLIVADFHTYFVGEVKALSHDNTPIEPTDVLVPGLKRRR